MGIAIGLPIFLGIGIVGIASTVFWIWMLVDCLVKEPSDTNDKLLWALIIFFGHLLGALLYVLVRRPERQRMYGE